MRTDSKLAFLHIHTLAALYGVGSGVALDLVLRGGAALRFGYGSPRASEDLDMLIKRSDRLSADADSLMQRVRQYVSGAALAHFGQDRLTLINRRNAHGHNPLVYELRLAADNPAVADDVLKVEFFAVAPSLLASYARQPRALRDTMYPYVSPIATVADLREIFVDKVHALSARKYIKYRDIFDLWWLQKQPDVDWTTGLVESIHTHLEMYSDERSVAQVVSDANKRLEAADTAAMRKEIGRFVAKNSVDDKAMNAMIAAARSAVKVLEDAAAVKPKQAARMGI